MTEKITSEDLKKKSEIPSQNALKMHPLRSPPKANNVLAGGISFEIRVVSGFGG